MKILIADDDLLSRKILSVVTAKWQYEPVLAEDGEQARLILEQEEPPLLLLIDWEMPHMNGIELCHYIRAIKTDNPPFIILLTARSEVDDIVNGLDAGANDYIVKPFSNAELKARIDSGRRMLELQAALHQTQKLLNYEREVIENVLLNIKNSQVCNMDFLRIIEIPVEKTSGDILLSAFKNKDIQHILLGDFTGHGLTAAIGGPVVFSIFYSMTYKNMEMAEIVAEINHQMVLQLPIGLFLGGIFIEMNHATGEVTLWNCGMSDILIYRHAKLLKRIPSHFMALGIIDEAIEPIVGNILEADDYLYAYSDGMTELLNSEEEEYGQAQLEQDISEILLLDKPIDSLIEKLNHFKGDTEQSDDLTFLELKR